MKRFEMKILFILLAAAVLLPVLFGCGKPAMSPTGSSSAQDTATDEPCGTETDETDAEVGIKPDWNNRERNGICLVLPGAKQNTDILIDTVGTMNVKCTRLWMHATALLDDPTTPNAAATERNRAWISSLREAGVTKIVGMSHYWFLPEHLTPQEGNPDLIHSSAPYPDADDPDYAEFLDLYEATWQTLAATYPEVGFWEVGNEVNFDLYLHPLDYESHGTKFTREEKAELTADLCYRASRGIHRANPEAIVIFPGMAPVDGFSSMATFLEQVYKTIEARDVGDTNCYFQAVAWHGYFLKSEYSLDAWLDGNRSVYAVMERHGDGDKKVFLTEFGFSDGGDPETDARQAGWLAEIFGSLDRLPFVDSVYPFRLMDYRSSKNADPTEIYYGMMCAFYDGNGKVIKTCIGAKEKGKTLCRLYGGDVEKLDRYLGGHKVYGGNT